MDVMSLVAIPPTPTLPHKGGGSSFGGRGDRMKALKGSPSPLWGGARGGGTVQRAAAAITETNVRGAHHG